MSYRTYGLLSALLLTSLPLVAEPARLEAVAWMVGDWSSHGEQVTAEERWSRPWGGVMVGVHRDERADGRLSFEYLRVEETAEGLVYLASPQGRCPATPFRLVELGDRRAVFANPEHDFPKRIVYWIAADGALHARAESEDGEGPEWRWQRVGD